MTHYGVSFTVIYFIRIFRRSIFGRCALSYTVYVYFMTAEGSVCFERQAVLVIWVSRLMTDSEKIVTYFMVVRYVNGALYLICVRAPLSRVQCVRPIFCYCCCCSLLLSFVVFAYCLFIFVCCRHSCAFVNGMHCSRATSTDKPPTQLNHFYANEIKLQLHFRVDVDRTFGGQRKGAGVNRTKSRAAESGTLKLK